MRRKAKGRNRILNSMFHDYSISDNDFYRMVHFIQSSYGIDLSKKRQLISSRLSPSLKERGYQDFHSFLEDLLSEKKQADIELVLNKLTTNYTFFMREQDHFAYFEKVILPELVKKHERNKVLSIWSAGCSSGEEPYTLSIYLREFFGSAFSQWDTRILATDISQQALSKAKAGVYPHPAGMPVEWIHRYFILDQKSGLYSVCPQIKNNVIFRTFNLMDPIRFRLKFDVIFCRNVMFYFDAKTRNDLIQRFYGATENDGYLFVSHSESLGQTPLYRSVAPAVYQKTSSLGMNREEYQYDFSKTDYSSAGRG